MDRAVQDVIKIVTLAPEMPGAKELIRKLREHGIIASMGHTAATYEEAVEGIETGITHTTHLFNAMSGIHHRNPGAAAAALSSGVYCELIADMVHVHPGLFEMIRKAKGADRITLITDCMEAGGMPDGNYTLEASLDMKRKRSKAGRRDPCRKRSQAEQDCTISIKTPAQNSMKFSDGFGQSRRSLV